MGCGGSKSSNDGTNQPPEDNKTGQEEQVLQHLQINNNFVLDTEEKEYTGCIQVKLCISIR